METTEPAVQVAMDLSRRFATSYTPRPYVALLAGSRARGTSTPGSDYDLVFLYESLPDGAWREMTSFETGVVELFAHDLSSLKYFFSEIELPSGEASLASMVEQGIPVLGADDPIARAAKELAQTFLAAGPLPLTDAGLLQRRYAITDMAEAVKGAASSTQRLAIGSALYPALANFYLLTNRRWAAGGKAIPAALHSFNPDMDQMFTNAFEQLYRESQGGLLQELISEILKPFGGRLRAGFRQQAPPSWKK